MATKEQMEMKIARIREMNRVTRIAKNFALDKMEVDLGVLLKGVKLGELVEGTHDYPKFIDDLVSLVHQLRQLNVDYENPFEKGE